MARYRSKIVEIDAVHWMGNNIDEVLTFCYEDTRWRILISDEESTRGPGIGYTPPLGTLDIPTLEGVMTANVGDFIIRGLMGELYPCKADIFEMKYEMI